MWNLREGKGDDWEGVEKEGIEGMGKVLSREQ